MQQGQLPAPLRIADSAALRVRVDALQFSEEHGEVCPAGWQKGDTGMKASVDKANSSIVYLYYAAPAQQGQFAEPLSNTDSAA